MGNSNKMFLSPCKCNKPKSRAEMLIKRQFTFQGFTTRIYTDITNHGRRAVNNLTSNAFLWVGSTPVYDKRTCINASHWLGCSSYYREAGKETVHHYFSWTEHKETGNAEASGSTSKTSSACKSVSRAQD